LSRIADYFQRDPVSLCQGIAKVEKRMREEDGFREKLMRLEKNLVEDRKRVINLCPLFSKPENRTFLLW
jgi:predicted transcriptional regulator